MWIETNSRKEITSRDEYIRGFMRIEENITTRAAGNVTIDSIRIKGRGNMAWSMPKKPYRIRLDNRLSLFDAPEDKNWILINNYADKTMLRNSTAFYMSIISNLGYTPRSHFVEVILNGRYNGTYLFCEKLRLSKNRIDADFLMEFDVRRIQDTLTARYIKLNHLEDFPDESLINIKEPEVEYGDENYEYAKKTVTKAEDVLFSDNFRDSKEGWQKYIDINSFVDWYLINEITKNNDACLYSSCFMHLTRGGKLIMGPVWDYDIAFGNVNYNGTYLPQGFWVKNTKWFTRLFEDPEFVRMVKSRFDYFYSQKDNLLRKIDDDAVYLKYAAQENENRWHTFYTYTWPNYNILGNYYNEVQYMKKWLIERLNWLKAEFDAM